MPPPQHRSKSLPSPPSVRERTDTRDPALAAIAALLAEADRKSVV